MSAWSASMRPGAVGVDVWKKGTPPKSTTYQACLLELSRGSSVREVTGKWLKGRVTGWQFGRVMTTTRIIRNDPNIRIRADGRVARTY